MKLRTWMFSKAPWLLATALLLSMLHATPAEALSRAGALSASPTAPMSGERVRLSGRLPGASRPVRLQIRSGTKWLPVAGTRSKPSGRFSFATSGRGVASKYRAFAPRTVTKNGNVYKSVVTPTVTVAASKQSGKLASSTPVQVGKTITLTATFRPVRVGRTVTLQREDSSGWRPLSQTTENSSGIATFQVKVTGEGVETYRALAAPHAGSKSFSTPEHDVFTDVRPPDPDVTPPPVPSGVFAAAGNGQVTVSWDAVTAEDLSSYGVYRATSADGPWILVATTTAPDVEATITGLANDTPYYFAITSRDHSGNESGRSSPDFATPRAPDNTPPPVPSNVVAAFGDASAHISWDVVASADLAGYKVYRTAGQDAMWALIATLGPQAQAYDVTGLTNGTTYRFAVTSYDLAGNESTRSEVSAGVPVPADRVAPPVPTGVLAVPQDGAVDLSWQPVIATDLHGYSVYYSKAGDAWTKYNATPMTATSLRVGSLMNGYSYAFAVSAVDTSGNESTQSSTATTTPRQPPPEKIDRCGTIAADQAWGPQSVQHLTCPVVVPVGVTLTIAAGTVVKAAPTGGIIAEGTLIAVGTQGAPVALTSWRDDSQGGDTNHDGAATTPAIGDWVGLDVRAGGGVQLDHTEVAYGRLVGESGRLLTLTDTHLTHSSIALRSNGPITLNRVQVENAKGTCCDASLEVVGPSALSISGSTIRTSSGINLAGGGAVTLAGNAFETDTLARWSDHVALSLPGTGAVEIEQNTFTSTSGARGFSGLYVIAHEHGGLGPAPFVRDNTFTNYSTPVVLLGDAVQPSRLSGNTGIDLTHPAVMVSGEIEEDWTIPLTSSDLPVGVNTDGVDIPVGRRLAFPQGATLYATPGGYRAAVRVHGTLLSGGSVSSPSRVQTAPGYDASYGPHGGVLIDSASAVNVHDFRVVDGPFSVDTTAAATIRRVSTTGAAMWIEADGWIDASDLSVADAECAPCLAVRQRGTQPLEVARASVTHARAPSYPPDDPATIVVANDAPNAQSPHLVDLSVQDSELPAYRISGSNLFPEKITNVTANATKMNALVLSGTINWDLVLPRHDIPPVVLDDVRVSAGATIDLGPRAVLKTTSKPVVIYGSLDAHGTASEPAVITALGDDREGDTNGDGDASSPKWWGWIEIRHQSDVVPTLVSVDHLAVRWGGLVVTGGTGTIKNSMFEDSGGIRFYSANGSVTDSTFRRIAGWWEWEAGPRAIGISEAPGQVTITGNTIDRVAKIEREANSAINVTTTGMEPPAVQNNTIGRAGGGVRVEGRIDLSKLTHNVAIGMPNAVLWVDGDLVASATLPMDTLPLVVGPGGLRILPDVTLRLKQGQQVKSWGPITVLGSLATEGVPGSPVTFTNQGDDLVGGDTNGDGSYYAPFAGSWPGIRVAPEGSANLQGVRIRYADTAVASSSGYLVVVRGEITQNVKGVTSCGEGCPVDARLVWWGTASGPVPSGTGNSADGPGIAYVPWLGSDRNLAATWALDPYAGLVSDVNPALGALVLTEDDIDVEVPGPALKVARVYSSQNTATSSFFGRGWTSTYEMQLTVPTTAPVNGDIATVKNSDGRLESFTYASGDWSAPSSGSILEHDAGTWSYRLKNGVTYDWDSASRLTRVRDGLDRDLTLTYDDNGKLSKVLASNGRALFFSWSGNHVGSVETDLVAELGRALRWTYTYSGDDLTSACEPAFDDGRARCATYTWAEGRLVEVKDANGHVDTRVTYLSDGKVATRTDGNQKTTQFTYQVPSTVLVTSPRGGVTTNVYDERLRLVSTTDPEGMQWLYQYDATTGLRSATTDPLGNVTSQTYDASGNVTSETDGTGATAFYTYSASGDLLEERGKRSLDAQDTTYLTKHEYDAKGNRVLDRGPPVPGHTDGILTTRTFSDGTESASGGGTIPPGLMTSETDGNGKVTRFAYTAAGDLAQIKSPAGGTTRMTYDALGRMLSRTQNTDDGSEARVAQFTLDPMGRIVDLVHPETTNAVTGAKHQLRERKIYDLVGNLTGIELADLIGGDARRASFTYDSADRQLSATDAENGVTRRTFDSAGNVASVTDAEGRETRFTYDRRNLLTKITATAVVDDPSVPTAPHDVILMQREYDDAGRLRKSIDANGAEIWRMYDAAGRQTLTQWMNPIDVGPNDPGPCPLVLTRTQYDEDGNVVSESLGDGGCGPDQVRRTDRIFDAGGRVTSERLDPGGLDRRASYRYDGSGNMVASTLSDSNATESSTADYDDAGRPTAQSIFDGSTWLTTTYGYNAFGDRISTVDPRGSVAGASASDYATSATYDAMQRLITVKAPARTVEEQASAATTTSPVARRGYNAFGDVTEVQDESGAITTMVYDGLGRLVRKTWPEGRRADDALVSPSQTYRYDHVGNLIGSTDRRGGEWIWVFSSLNHPVMRIRPGTGNQRTFHWENDIAGNVTATVDETGARVEMTYDHRGLMTSRTEVVRQPSGSPDRFTTAYEYDSLGNRTAVVTPGGHREEFTYSTAGEMLTGLGDDGIRRTWRYDLRGRVASVKEDRRLTTYRRNAAGFVTSRAIGNPWDTDMHVDTYTVDAVGNRLTEVTAAGRRTEWSYDADNNVTSAAIHPTADKSVATTYGYDASGRMTRLTDGRGNATWTTYNSWGQRASVVEPSTPAHPAVADRTWTWGYDAGGLPVSERQPGDVSLTRTYDASGNLTAESGSGIGVASADRSWAYDAAGRMSSFSVVGGTQSQTYDDRGLLTSSTGPAGATTWTYNGSGQPIARDDATGHATFAWNDEGLLSEYSDPLTESTLSYYYDGDQVEYMSVASAGGTSYESRDYNELGRLRESILHDSDDVLRKETHEYDADGLLIGANVTFPGQSKTLRSTFTHDGAGRLSSWTEDTKGTERYVWDDAGNLTNNGARSLAYDERNRLIESGGVPVGSNARGDRLTEPGHNRSWDAFGELVADTGASYTYDALGRIATRNGARFSYDGFDQRPVEDGDATYSWTPDQNLVSVRSRGTSTLVSSNDHGDTVAAFVPNGTLVATREFSPFGTSFATTGTFPGTIGFDQGWIDPATGGSLQGARWYDAHSGAFLSRDTILGDLLDQPTLNRYLYANGDPLDFADPAGTWGISLSSIAKTVTNTVKAAVSVVKRAVATAVKVVTTVAKAVVNTVTRIASGVATTTKVVVGAVQKGASATVTAASSAVASTAQRIAQIPAQIKQVCTDKATLCGKLTAITVDTAKATTDWVVDHRADIAGVAVGIVAGAGCVAASSLTGFTAAVACGAVAGAAGSAVSGFMRNGSVSPAEVGAGVVIGGLTGGIGTKIPGLVQAGSSAVRGAPAAASSGAKAAPDGISLALRYRPGWSTAQRSAADAKVAALNDAADAGALRVTPVRRVGTSAASRYRSAGGMIPRGADVDHTIDLQLGGLDDVTNMSPLDLSVNRSLGPQIRWQLQGVEPGTCVVSVKIC